jgi:hypothetical protein
MFEKHESAAFCWAARRLVRVGMRAEKRRAILAHRQGAIQAAELEGRLAACEEVAAL